MAVWSTIKLSDVINYTRIDGDFYKPEYLEYRDILKGYKNLSYYVKEIIHPGEFKRIYSPEGISVLRAQNIRPLKIEIESNSVFIPKEIANNLYRNKLVYGDILITRTGANFGQTALFTDELENAVVTSHTFILKTNNKIESAFLALYLNTKYGRKLLDQGMYGSSQPEIAPKFIKIIPVPRFEYSIENKLTTNVLKAYKLRQQSQSLYKQAIDLLEQGLGLEGVGFEKPKSYIAKFSEVVSNFRNDADYYQTKYRQLDAHLKTKETVALSSICNFLKGFEVGTSLYTLEGPVFIRVSNLTKDGFKFGNADKYISETTHSSLKAFQPIIGDILLTKDGTIGTCYVVDENVKGIISSGIMNLELTDNSIPKEYLALVINSKICQMQAERECSGALISHWKPEQIRRLRIPVLTKEIMQEISELVVKSKDARKQSQQLLTDAKARVEQLIEEATN